MTTVGHLALATLGFVEVFEHINHKFNTLQILLLYLAVLFGAVLPDIDEPNSYIGKRSLLFSDIMQFLGLKHRGFTHFLIIPIFITTFNYIFFHSIYLYALAFGILMHVAGDLITISGIKGFFWPFWKERRVYILPRILRFQVFTIKENIYVFFILIFILHFFLQKFMNLS
ncbi:metal-dependent hydrolase [Aquamicrobium sp.]|uniref:metal-dependent hydrolase n=1 Tax=Aquamicrobium sp. TaxID=1872579 RepID=UPI00338E8587